MLTRDHVLSEKYMLKVKTLFDYQKWDVSENQNGLSLFDRFCCRLAELCDDEDKDFLLKLSEDYLWVKLEQYEELLKTAIKTWVDQNTEIKGRIVICPLLVEKDFHKVKSSVVVAYLFQSVFLRDLKVFHENQISIVNAPAMLLDTTYYNHEDYLLLVDDFLGSGNTALGCLKYLHKKRIILDKASILVLVAQASGVELIAGQEKIPVISAIERKKGISDFFRDQSALRRKQMEKISKQIGAQNIALGYDDSEALVTMIRTPNNTFPFYWHEKKKTVAPFPRLFSGNK